MASDRGEASQMSVSRIVDSDSHILEPANLWEEKLEPQYRSRALSIRRDENNLEYLSVDGKKSLLQRGGEVAALGFIGKSQEWKRENADLSYSEVATVVPGAVATSRADKVHGQ